ncbi:beta strand repeat-containing protein [Methanobrevibacter sp. DSM 116169]|uniref:beta strand repeat-containing protein n=1 Tax=Methanobrevibacter sp. DSM 116169 TaxID=3242727 RepID=UPI0038FCC0C5
MKILKIFLIFLVLIFSLNFVSAEGNFTDLEGVIENELSNELVLNQDYTFNEETDENLTNGIVISRDNFIINGNGSTIDANHQSKIFNITGNNVTLKNIILINAMAIEGNVDGAAIHNTGNFTIINATISNSKAITGAAIYSMNGTFTITDTTFTDNFGEVGGAAIYMENSEGIITNSVFSDGIAYGGSGAAIINQYSSLRLVNCNFTNNRANDYGAGINNRNASLTVVNCIFTENEADFGGGAIANFEGGNITINDSLFEYNKQVIDQREKGGAAIANYEGNIGIFFSNFTYNEASVGAAIFNDIGIITAQNCTFINNTAEHIANDIYNNDIAYLINNRINTTNNVPLVYNDVNGTLSLEKNYMYLNNLQKIYNDGMIITEVWIVIYSNTTYNGTYGKDTKLFATISDDFGNVVVGGNITLSNPILGNFILSNDNINNEQYEIFFKPNATGIFHFNATEYEGTNNLSSRPGTLIVPKNNITLNLTYDDMFSDKNQSIIVNVNPGASGNVTYIHNNQIISIPVQNGTVIFKNLNLSGGNHNITIFYTGDDNYNNFTQDLTVLVRSYVNLTASDIFMFYKDGTQYIAILKNINGTALVGQLIFITINGVTYNRTTDSEGKVRLTINLDPKVYNVTTYYDGNEIYSNASVNTFIDVESTLTGEDITKLYRNDTQYYVNLTDKNGTALKNVNVTFNINGAIYYRETNENGTARLNINLDPGQYIITATYDDLSISNNIKVISLINGSDITKMFQNGTQYYATLVNTNGTPLANRNVTMNINGVMYTRQTNENGTVRLNINLDQGEYIITVNHPDYNLGYSNKITVLPILIGNDTNMTTDSRKAYEVKALNATGAPVPGVNVTININGVLYNRTTDIYGVAKLNINLDPGSYIATATWKEFSTSNIVSVVLA